MDVKHQLLTYLPEKERKKMYLQPDDRSQSCVKVEVVVLGFPSLIVLMVSVDVKQHLKQKNSVHTASSLPHT